ncbi:cation/calcium exchanger 1 [Brachypodium distachyon]|uniref:Sodium/calcium exchanger membrane region domain-containing protein n=1 Tax=Brachypodium distachyon TaxID=15368 RepID=I1I467_BRADI|nr:cation/calcium exchanger 1 [Brachypodium distachyon]KQJ96801.1 hypothetical protein BRADI_3g27220v3 [Brachypodium distachyon]|eukprot:XP_010234752.1 cation/calcium exchanger 1 [Brachypodium distachyon]
MAKPSSAATAAVGAKVLIACLNVGFLLLLTFFCLSRPGVEAAVPLLLDGVGQRLDQDKCDYHGDSGSAFERGRGHVDYLYLFYCVCGEERRALGYAFVAAWLAVLFYLLGDTAAVYFCSSLEGLSRLLRLSPAIAGATLLSLGNGAPDALSTIASFASGGGGEGGGRGTTVVGLNGLLGGALFVSSAVLGVICLRPGGPGRGFPVDRRSFFRDASFLLLALTAVAVVLAAGKVNIWGALAFTSLYLFYVLAVAFTHGRDRGSRVGGGEEETDHTNAALSELCDVAETNFYPYQDQEEPLLPETAPLLQYHADDESTKKSKRASVFWSAVRVLELPLYLPRRLTIPDASKERWSKPAAVTAAALSPLFLSFLWSHTALALLLGGLAGVPMGLAAFLTTDTDAPPTRFRSAWLAGGFVMSVAWAYVIANELLSLLVSASLVLAVDPATLGLTVLAWGNSLGDLVANVAVAMSARGGGGGAQVAVAGCYGGPVFNVLVGLGLSLVLSCWAGYPRPVEIPREARLYQTLGFVAAGVLWTLVMLPRKGMWVDRTLGFGLLGIYFCFLCASVLQALGIV